MNPSRILIVDDEPTISDVLAAALVEEGYSVIVVHDGLSAIEEAERTRPDLVVSDVMMPGINGIRVAMRLRESDIPVILMTAIPERVRDLGLECLPKPFDLGKFLDTVNRALSMRP